MAFEDLDLNEDLEAAPPPEGRSNRTFIIVALGLIFFALVVVACLAAYALYYVPRQRQAQANQVATVNAQNTEVAASILATNVAKSFTATPQATPTNTAVVVAATETPVVVIPTNTLVPTGDPRTATVAALFTQAAQAQQTLIPTTTTTALPTTGFADEVGVPGLIGMAVLLLLVIFFARRLRTAG
ncbi:MAG: LPXTG cell wall anchor domain-containing protein [Anaerolineales bacterium]